MPTLFDSVELGALSLPNRILMAPMTRARAGEQRTPNALMGTYYTQCASAGLILTEATVISRQGNGWRQSPGIYTEEQAQGWRDHVVSPVHAG